jgi:hypothetical protein
MISAKASFFARRSGSVIGAGLPGRRARARRPRLAVAPQHRFEVEMLELLDKRLMEFVEKSARAAARPARRQPAKRPMARRG